MAFAELIQSMADAICRGDGDAAAACFHRDGAYHDVFYGVFPQAEIPVLVADRFHRDATNFVWDMHDAVATDTMGYARYVFSYDGKLSGCEGNRAMFEGVSVCDLKDGLILKYHEVANTATGLHMLGFPPERLAKVVARQAGELAARDESEGHR